MNCLGATEEVFLARSATYRGGAAKSQGGGSGSQGTMNDFPLAKPFEP